MAETQPVADREAPEDVSSGASLLERSPEETLLWAKEPPLTLEKLIAFADAYCKLHPEFLDIAALRGLSEGEARFSLVVQEYGIEAIRSLQGPERLPFAPPRQRLTLSMEGPQVWTHKRGKGLSRKSPKPINSPDKNRKRLPGASTSIPMRQPEPPISGAHIS